MSKWTISRLGGLSQLMPRLIAQCPQYLGHIGSLPKEGNYYVSAFANGRYVLVRTRRRIKGLLNVCPHRNGELKPVGRKINQELIARSGTVNNNGTITCPHHRLTYSADGELIRAPAFPDNKKPCGLRLSEIPIEMVGPLIFKAGKNARGELAEIRNSPGFKRIGIDPFTESDDLVLAHTDISHEDFSVNIFAEVYGDTDHVDDIHVGTFNQLVDMGSLVLEYGKDWSIQFVDWKVKTDRNVDPAYASYREKVLSRGGVPSFGAAWMMHGPDKTYEWYPLGKKPRGVEQYVFVASTVIPRGPYSTNVVEFYVPSELLGDPLVAAFIKAYKVTAEEDRHLCLSMQAGRETLIAEGYGSTAFGPTGPQEGCVSHYYRMLDGMIDDLNRQESIHIEGGIAV